MKQWMVTWGLALAMIVAQGAVNEANAAPNRVSKGRTPAKIVSRSSVSARKASRTAPRISTSAARGKPSASRISRPGRSSSSSRVRTSTPGSGSLGQALGAALAGSAGRSGTHRGNRGGYGGYDGGKYGDLLSELGRYADQSRWDDYYRDREKDRYRAHRDALIADTVVQVIGMVTSAQRPVTTCAPPPPVHEVRRVVVEPGHYERYKVYIEPVYDSRTGRKIDGGYHETRTRWVPPVYEERLVLVER